MAFNNKRLERVAYFAFMSAGALLGMIKLAIYAKVLGPIDYGLYGLLSSTYIYIMFVGSVGVNESLVKLGAMAYGRGEYDVCATVRDLSFTLGGISTVVLSLFVVFISMIYVDDMSILKVILLSGVFAFSTLEFNLSNTYLRIKQEFLLYSQILFFKSLIIVCVSYYISEIYGFVGVVLVEVVVMLFMFFLVFFLCRDKYYFLRTLKNLQLFKELIKNGLPMSYSIVIRNLSFSLDRWVVVSSLGIASLGRYSFVMIIYQVSMVGLNFLSTIFGVKWLAEYAKTGDIRSLSNDVSRVVLYVVVAATILSIPFFYVLEDVVEAFFAQYSGLGISFGYVYVGSALLIICFVCDWFFVATSNERLLLFASIVNLSFAAVMLTCGYYFSLGLEYYSYVFLLVRLLNLLLYLFLVSKISKFEMPS